MAALRREEYDSCSDRIRNFANIGSAQLYHLYHVEPALDVASPGSLAVSMNLLTILGPLSASIQYALCCLTHSLGVYQPFSI